MANANFEIDTGLTVANTTTGVTVTIDGFSGNVTTTGNLVLNSSNPIYSANAVMTKSYVDNIAVVFGL
jgi:hypothetical protein